MNLKKIPIWIRAVRPQFFTATIIPVILGSVIGWRAAAVFNWCYFWLCLIGIIFVHAGLDLANDYYDHKSGVDDINKTPTPFSGGSRSIQKGLLSPKEVFTGAITCFIITVLIGLYLNYLSRGNIILILGVIGVFLAFFYTADPIRIGYTGLGELSVGVGFGPVIVMGAYYLQTQQLTWVPFWASIPVAILIALVLYINEFPDWEADKAVKKRTLVVILGKEKAIWIYYVLLSLVYVYIITGVIFGLYPVYTLITLLSIPLALKAVKTIHKNYNRINELLPANALTIALHSLIGLGLIIGYVIK